MNCLAFFDLQTVKDVILIFSSTTSVVFVFIGFNKWKKELKGRTKYELARKLLKELFTFRNAFKSLRSTLTFAHELPPRSGVTQINEAEQERYVFTNRMNHFSSSYNSFLSLLPETEVEFDSQLHERLRDLLYQITKYQMSLNEYLQLIGNTNNDEHLQMLRRVVYAIGDDNPTTQEFMSAVVEIELEVKNVLKKY